MYTYLQQALPRVVINIETSEEMEVVSTVQPYEGEPHASNEDFDQD